MLRNSDDVMATLHKLKEMGVAIVTDDFGTPLFDLELPVEVPVRQNQDRSQLHGELRTSRPGRGDRGEDYRRARRELKMRVTVEGVTTQPSSKITYKDVSSWKKVDAAFIKR